MYLPKHFEEARPEVLHALIRARPLAALVTFHDGRLEAEHIPLLHIPGPGPLGVLRGHVARANPIWRERAGGAEVLALFQGPDAYVTPSWYPSKHETGKAVPTWNYLTVHAHGTLEAHDDPDWLRALLAALTDSQEAAFPAPWRMADAPADYLDEMIRRVVGIEIALTGITGKWKTSQNQPTPNRAGVAAGLRGLGTDAGEGLAGLIELL